MSKYDPIDAELYAWAKNQGLHIFTEYKDYEVRTTDVVGSSGKRCQIWVEPSYFSTFVINVWDYKKRRVRLRAWKINIGRKLEKAYQTAQAWLK